MAGLLAAYRTQIEAHAAGLMVVDILFGLGAVCMLTFMASRRPPFDPAVLGIVLGLLVTGLLLAWMTTPQLLNPEPGVFASGNLLLLALHLAAAIAILHLSRLPLWARARLTVAVALLSANRAISYPALDDPSRSAAALVTALLGAALLCATCLALLRFAIRNSNQQFTEMHDRVEQAEREVREVREDRERLHEINATIAGIASATRLIHGGRDVSPHRKGRLQDMVDSEIARLERLMDHQRPELRVVDLDETIRPLVVAQQALNRRVAWTPSGYSALGRADDIAEVVSILLNNAAKHAPGATVLVAVHRLADTVEIRISDSGPGVSLEMAARLFDWGARGPESSGEGIGLNVARRLMDEQGGSLRLHSSPSSGTVFVLDLQTARQAHGAVGACAE